MTTTSQSPSDGQRTAARVAGVMYLVLMASSMFAELVVFRRIKVPGDAVQTALNILASERLFRVGIAVHVLTVAGDVVLLAALYVLLAPVNRGLALLAAFWRLVQNSILATVLLGNLVALLLLKGPDYLQTIPTAQRQVLARVTLGWHAVGFNVGLTFLGLGAAVFAYLLFKSRYVPRLLAGWGVFAYLVMAIVGLSIIVLPQLGRWQMASFMPAFVFEVTTGLWFLIRGVNLPGCDHLSSMR